MSKGITKYSADAALGASLGLGGFIIINDTKTHYANEPGTNDGTNTYHPDIGSWFAIKAIDDDVVLSARSLAGDNLSQDGTYAGTAITIQQSDLIYGSFDRMKLTSGRAIVYICGKMN